MQTDTRQDAEAAPEDARRLQLGQRPRRPLDQPHGQGVPRGTNHSLPAAAIGQLLGALGEAFQLNHGHKGCRFGQDRCVCIGMAIIGKAE